ncbi:MAG: hypothetical protein E6Q97_02655 [Desulfurellales bacterium]|nr:MAG: hypothetical protein E6Q97_02655 [Desulfurellales bacterium]
MALKTVGLTLANLGELLPGRAVELAFEEALERIKKDMAARNTTFAPRELTLRLKFKPQKDQNGFIGEADVDVDVSCKLPGAAMRGRIYCEAADVDGELHLGLLFLQNQRTPANPAKSDGQQSMIDGEQAEG